jgi:hypothetical protein
MATRSALCHSPLLPEVMLTLLAHQTMDLIINHETDDDILDDDNATLASVGIGQYLPSAPTRASVTDPFSSLHRKRVRDQLLQPRLVRRIQGQSAAGVVARPLIRLAS